MKLAAGVLPYCIKTGRFLIAKRGTNISDPNLWTSFGGKSEEGESSQQCARREFKEESGYTGNIQLTNPVPIKTPDGYVFVNYVGLVPNEFRPTTIGKKTVDGDVEVQAAKWVTKEELKKLMGSKILHPGFRKSLLQTKLLGEQMKSKPTKRQKQIVEHFIQLEARKILKEERTQTFDVIRRQGSQGWATGGHYIDETAATKVANFLNSMVQFEDYNENVHYKVQRT